MTRFRFFLGLFGFQLSAQKVTPRREVGPSVPRKPANGQCPCCGTFAFVDINDKTVSEFKRGHSWIAGGWGQKLFMGYGYKTLVECRICHVIFTLVTPK